MAIYLIVLWKGAKVSRFLLSKIYAKIACTAIKM